MVGLKKCGVVGKEKSPEAGLFVHHQFDQVVGVRDNLIGAINPASIALNLAEPVNQSQGKQSHGKDGQSEKADKQTSIRGGFQKVSRGGSSTVGKRPETELAAYSAILPDSSLSGQRQGTA
jgi:hypothetical protein